MQLRTVDGKLTLGSVYKVIVWGWVLGMSAFMIPIALIIAIDATISGQMSFNGEMIYGSGPVFMHVLPLIVMAPIIIVFHAFTFGGLITFGVDVPALATPGRHRRVNVCIGPNRAPSPQYYERQDRSSIRTSEPGADSGSNSPTTDI
jgi:hypothetical protein